MAELRRDESKKLRFPGLKIIDRYIIRKFLGTYFFAISLIVIVVVVFDAVEKMDDFVEMKAPFKAIAIDYYLNFVPYFMNQFSGLFTFIAVIFFTSKMAYQTEIIAILSSCTSFLRMMWPYFLSALAIALFSLMLSLFVIPRANGYRVEFERRYFKRNQTLKYEPNIYRQIYPGTFAYIRNFDGKNNRASYLAIEAYEGSTIVSTLEAASVTVDPETNRWTAPKYVIRTFDGEVEQFTQYEKLDTTINLDVMELGKLSDIIQTMPIKELNQFIAQQKAKGSDMLGMFEVERQNRFSYPIATFILTLIGVSLSSRKVRGGTGLHMGIGIGLCFAYIMLTRFGEEFAKNSAGVSPALMVWIPNIVFAVIAVYLYRKAPK